MGYLEECGSEFDDEGRVFLDALLHVAGVAATRRGVDYTRLYSHLYCEGYYLIRDLL